MVKTIPGLITRPRGLDLLVTTPNASELSVLWFPVRLYGIEWYGLKTPRTLWWYIVEMSCARTCAKFSIEPREEINQNGSNYLFEFKCATKYTMSEGETWRTLRDVIYWLYDINNWIISLDFHRFHSKLSRDSIDILFFLRITILYYYHYETKN